MENLEEEIQNLNKIVHHIPVERVMTKPAKTVNVNEEFSTIQELFSNEKIHHLPVVDGSKKIVGLISQRDVHRRISPRRAPDGSIMFRKDIVLDGDGYYEKESLNKYILNYVMKQDPTTLTIDRTLGDVIHIMDEERAGCVPIVNEKNNVIGVVTRFDILKLVAGIS